MDRATAARIRYGIVLLRRYLADDPVGDTRDLVHAQGLFEKVLADLPEEDNDRPWVLHNSATVWYQRFKASGAIDLLGRALARQEEALARAAKDDEDLCVMQVSLAVMLCGDVLGGQRREELDRAVALVRDAAEAAVRHPHRPVLLANIALVLLSHPLVDLDEVDRLTRAAANDLPAGKPESVKLNALRGRALHRRFLSRGALTDLKEAITAAERAVDAAPAHGPLRVDALLLLAAARQSRWRLTGSADDLAAAVDLRRAATAASPAPSQLPDLHSGLCAALRDRYERHADPADLDAALTAGRAGLRASGSYPSTQACCLGNLSGAYRTRFERTRRPDDLGRAVRLAREAVAATLPDDSDRPRWLGVLTLALLRDFGFRRDPDLVDEAIQVSRDAVSAAPPDHPLRAPLLANAANVLRARHEWTGDLADLNEAVALARDSVNATDPRDTGRSRRQTGLAAALLRRFEAAGRRTDIDEAVRIGQAAVTGCPEGHPERAGLLANVGVALYRRFEAEGHETDLDNCLKSSIAAVENTPAGDPDRPRRLSQLVAPLRERYLLSGVERDLEAAVAAAQSSVRLLGDGDTHFNLGMALRLRYERDNVAGVSNDAHRTSAIAAFAASARSTGTAPLIRAAAARYEAQLCVEAGDWVAADGAYGRALQLLPVLVGRHLGWDSRHRTLARLVGLGADAAAVAVRLKDPERAVLILEQTRGILIGQSIEQHRDVQDLRRADHSLADEFGRLGALLATDTAASTEFEADPASLADPAAARRDAVARWENLIDRIRRTVPGQERFLAPPEFGELLAAAAGGPVVIVNVSRFRCDALIVRETGVVPRSLPALTRDELNNRVPEFVAATAANDEDTNAVLRRVVDWLWGTVAEPVLTALGPLPERVWWMPTGALSALPLHAAASSEPGGPAVFDQVVSSNTTTLRALIDARSRLADPHPDPGAVVVAITETPGHRRLPRAAVEAGAVRELVGSQAKLLHDECATRSSVLSALRDAVRAHFACHAVADLVDPASSALLLADGPLSVRDVAALAKLDRSLAYLSACTTALSEGLLADEGIHVASGFQLTGFRNVIGTLWRIDDDTAGEIAEGFYRLLQGGQEPAVALHGAVREVRARHPSSPALWGAFVHMGA